MREPAPFCIGKPVVGGGTIGSCCSLPISSTNFAATSRGNSAPTRPRTCSTPPTPRCTKSNRWAWSSPKRRPKTQDDLQSAVELAARYKVPILPRGAGSSLGGQAIGHALILDCSRWLDSILDIYPQARTATVEPGVVLADLNATAAKFGLTFGPDPASAERATLGGVIGNNATGAHSILYGMSADHLISADVILGDGTLETWDANGRSKLASTVRSIQKDYSDAIKQNFPKTWRNSAGYRLNYLLPLVRYSFLSSIL